jgi:two-component system sensor histidine kinase KdpD
MAGMSGEKRSPEKIFIKSLYRQKSGIHLLIWVEQYFCKMAEFPIKRISTTKQYIYSILLIVTVSAVCYALTAYVGYQVVALILLLTVSVTAISFDILPVLLSAVLSAVIWNFFFIPPRFTFHVRTSEDLLLLVMYFVIATINAVMTFKIRQIEKMARKKEEKANAIKLYNTLLNSLSHELRTPIATIIGATDNLQSGNGHLTDQNREQLISEIYKASSRLNQQVENLLNMSRLESGFITPKKDWSDINEIIYQVVAKIEENKILQKISISVNPNLPMVKTDKVMLEQIIYNILNNAIIYTPPSSLIVISASQHADILQIVIDDNGDGFPEDEINNVFEKFYRLRNTKSGGTGLGLSIVKGFTEALKGTVHLRNLSTGGCRFTIEIPCETSDIKSLRNEQG